MKLAFQSIGIVYGDIGTSPLYALPGIFPDGIKDNEDLLGALSLIFYSIILITLIKYVFIVLAANDNGEGGTFALYSLICRYCKASLMPNHQKEDNEVSNYKLEVPSTGLKRASFVKSMLENTKVAKYTLLFVTLLGTSMVLGDGILTPCISVLSAMGGIKVAAPDMTEDLIVWVSVIILIFLFQLQRFGTDKVGYSFAPILALWFVSIALIGIFNFFKYDPGVIKAINPWYIVRYFARNKKDAWISMGGVILCLTGSEALFADLGHFNVRSIRISSCSLVFPSILFAYFGQISYLRKHNEDVLDTFYKSIPTTLFWPMFIVAVMAAIIASQALISASFSIIHQSMALGCFPRVKIVHTSTQFEGQIYVPEINHLLMLACLGVTIGFRNTLKIGNAYGLAVAFVFQVTSGFLLIVMIMIWKTNIIFIILYVVFISFSELAFLSSVVYKFVDGGYLPLLFAALLVTIMYIWSYGYRKKYMYELENKVSSSRLAEIASDPVIHRVPGVALFYTEVVQGISPIFTGYIRNVSTLHTVLVFVSIKVLHIGKVPPEERFLFGRLKPHDLALYRCVVRYGYKDARTEWESFEEILLTQLKDFMLKESFVVGEIEDNEVSDQEKANLHNQEVQKQLGLVDEALKNGGIVYMLGETEVIASRGSSYLKKFVIDYCYNWLKRCVRQSDEIFMIPRRRLLKVAMTAEV